MQRQQSLGFVIARTDRRIRQWVSGKIRDLSLSAPQFWLLVRICEREGGSLGELARQARIDEPTASRVVFALVRRGLVRSEVDPADRRRSRLYLTHEGRRLTDCLLAASEEIRSAVEGARTFAERDAVACGLQKVVARLDRLEAGLEGRVGS